MKTSTIVCVLVLACFCFADEVKPPQPSYACPDEAKRWENTEFTSAIWQAISSGQFMANLRPQFDIEPCLAHVRSLDGRGPLFWAYEFDRHDVIHYLKERLADEDALDVHGKKPAQMAQPKDFGVGFRAADPKIEVITGEEKKRRQEEEDRKKREEEEENRKQQEREEEEEFMRLARERSEQNEDDKDEL